MQTGAEICAKVVTMACLTGRVRSYALKGAEAIAQSVSLAISKKTSPGTLAIRRDQNSRIEGLMARSRRRERELRRSKANLCDREAINTGHLHLWHCHLHLCREHQRQLQCQLQCQLFAVACVDS